MAVVNSSRFNMSEAIDWAVKKQLEDWQGDVLTVTGEVVQEVAREAVKRLKKESPRSDTKGHSGTYAKGWTYKVEKGRVRVGATVYGKPGTYQLAHLLEHGHAKRGGGRTNGIEHIKPVEEWAVGEVVDRTIERLEGI